MGYNLEVVYTRTEDELKLQGMHYAPTVKNIGVVFVHGMSGNFIENDYADVMGRTLAQNGIGYIYGHNRGYGHINDIVRGNPKPNGDSECARQGAWYERFSMSPKDIEAWVNQALSLGYKKIIVVGHSLGCSKIIYWWNRSKNTTKIIAVGLMSPVDMIGMMMADFSPKEYEELISEAKRLIANGGYTNLLSKAVDGGWSFVSANTFMEELVPNCPADVLPLHKPNDKFESLSKINVPLLMLYGEHESNKDKVVDDLAILKKRAIGSPKVQTTVIKGANHNYEGKEEALAKVILRWIKTL